MESLSARRHEADRGLHVRARQRTDTSPGHIDRSHPRGNTLAGPWPQPMDDWRRDIGLLPATLHEVAERAGGGC